MVDLSSSQRQIIEAPTNIKLFLSGPAGTGKSTAGVERLRYLLASGVPGESILVLTPQRTLQEPYLEIIHSPELVQAAKSLQPPLVVWRAVCAIYFGHWLPRHLVLRIPENRRSF